MRDSVSWTHHFEPYTATHACVVLAFAAMVTAMVAMRRRDDVALVPLGAPAGAWQLHI
jgi:hypothetical protein